MIEVQLRVGKGLLSNGCPCHAEIQGGPSRHTCPPAGFELFPFTSLPSSYEDRFLLQPKHKATLSGGEGTVTTRCISVGKCEVLAPSPGSSTTSCLCRCCSHPWLADHPAAPGLGTHGAASSQGKASSAERRGDDPQALLKWQTKRHLISTRRAITYTRSQLLFLLLLIPLL